MMIIWIIISILLFTIIILIHELWHFSASRLFWVKVEEFWLWIPPRAKKLFTDKKWTLYSLNWLPLWGFVRLKWENINQINNKDDKEALINKAIWQQTIVILAWIFMNFLFAIIVFSILFFVWIKPIWINSKIETNLKSKLIPTYEQAIESWFLKLSSWIILYPIKWSIAEKSWIKEWDILLKINNIKLNNPEEVIKIINENIWKDIELTISLQKAIKWEKIQNKKIILNIPLEWKIWVYLNKNIELNQDFIYKFNILNSLENWFIETYNQSLLTLKWLSFLLKNIFIPETPEQRKDAIKQVSWPIWIINFISSSISEWFIFLILIWAIISINLWVFNLLPIPALDWWRFLFILLNLITKKIFRRKIINENIESITHILFFIFLIALSLIIAYNDIYKIIIN